jgi:G3E family GTPase
MASNNPEYLEKNKHAEHAAYDSLEKLLSKNVIPVTILTGFLGSGKTTLLKYILNQPHGYKIAVIENEFGEENIDSEILINDAKPQIIQMSNGCICCNIRGDLQKNLNTLIEQRNKGEIEFDKIVIETTGVAEPGPIAQTFFLDAEINRNYRLDAVITLVDAKHAMIHLDKHVQVQQQIGFADKIFITKADLVDDTNIQVLKQRIIKINAKTPIQYLDHGKIDIAQFFDLKGFNLDDKLELDPHFIEQHKHQHSHEHNHKHEHADDCHDDHCTHEDHDHHHTHHHIDSIQSFVYLSDKPFFYPKLEEFLSAILTVYGEKLMRYKGVLYMKDLDRKVILQGVHQIMGSDVGAFWQGKPRSKLVFIGTDLPKDIIVQGLEMCH